MTAQRRVHRRPYLTEIVLFANFLLIVVLTGGSRSYVLATLVMGFRAFFLAFCLYAVAGVGARCVVAAFQGNLRSYLRSIGTAGWLSDTLRLVVVVAVLTHTYVWIKLMVPVLHPVLYDQQLWDLDQALFFGLSPTIFFINAFSEPKVLHFIDWSYARIYFASVSLAFAYFLSSPSRRTRLAFMTGSTYLWVGGAWLYMLIPSLGPALRFPDLWGPFAALLPVSSTLQTALMQNYAKVLQFSRGAPLADIQLVFGVAAFPSMHVGFQTFSFLWMRRVWISGQIIFGIFVLVILIGSVVTGWHYLLDGLAGILLAWLSYRAGMASWRIKRFLGLRSVLR